MNLNRNQVLAITIGVLSALAVSTAQLTDIFGPGAAKTIISVAGLLNSILSSILAGSTGQSGIIKDALAMPGVENIQVNRQANQTLASIAVDPAQDKIQPTPMDAAKVNQIATSGA